MQRGAQAVFQAVRSEFKSRHPCLKFYMWVVAQPGRARHCECRCCRFKSRQSTFFAKDERLLLIIRTIRGCGREVRYLLVKQNDDGSSPFSPVRLLSLNVQSGWLLTSRVAVRVRQKAWVFRVWGSGRPLVLGTSPRKFDSCRLDILRIVRPVRFRTAACQVANSGSNPLRCLLYGRLA